VGGYPRKDDPMRKREDPAGLGVGEGDETRGSEPKRKRPKNANAEEDTNFASGEPRPDRVACECTIGGGKKKRSKPMQAGCETKRK